MSIVFCDLIGSTALGVPQAHEDDALRAVQALGLQARIGVNTGEVVAGDREALVTGDAVNVAARLEQAAEPGEILLGSETRRLVRDAVRGEPRELELKGKSAAVNALSLQSLDLDAPGVVRRFDSPLVGRTWELCPHDDFEHAVEQRSSYLFTLLGRGRRQVPPRQRVHAWGRGTRTDRARPLPPLRRRNHLLAARG